MSSSGSRGTDKPALLSLVVPVYNEEESLRAFYDRVSAVVTPMAEKIEFIFVNDGSRDKSPCILDELSSRDPRVKWIDLSRNFGHQIAVKAGIDHVRGDAAVIMDADLQDPPETVQAMIRHWAEGYDVVYAVRKSRAGESFFKKITAAFFYRSIRKMANMDIPVDTGDYRLISRAVVDVLKGMRESKPYLRGLITWIGFRQIGVMMERQSRYAGVTKYPLKKMLQLAWNGITHFSSFPLQIATWLGLISAGLCLVWLLHVLLDRFVFHVAVPGWASLMVAILFLGAVQLLTLGILGSYVGRTYDEARHRPLYIIREKRGL